MLGSNQIDHEESEIRSFETLGSFLRVQDNHKKSQNFKGK